MKKIIGQALGFVIALWAMDFESHRNRIKWYWLAHFLLASGKSLTLPQWLAKDWNKNLVRYDRNNGKYLIRPYPSDLFWIVGSMYVTIEEGRVYGEDIYNFAPQPGQNVIHGNNHDMVYAWSGGEKDDTQIKGRLAKIGLFFFRAIGIGESIVKVEDDRLMISNELWNILGGVKFTTILEYKDDTIYP